MWKRRCGTYVQWNITQSWKGMDLRCSGVDEPRACYTEWTKSEREKQILYINTHTHTYIYIYMESRKVVLMNLFSEKEWRHKYREQLVDTMEEGKGRTDWESSIDTYTVSCVK